MKTPISGVFNKPQLDSILVNEKIPTDLNRWKEWALIDYETNDSIYQYLFIKDLSKTEIMYIITENDSLYYLNKRIVEKINNKK